MPQKYIMKKLVFITAMMFFTLLLSGCVQGIMPLPFTERYQNIHQTEEALELDTAGEVSEKIYDDNDGVFNESYIKMEVTGSEAYSIVVDHLKKITTNPCRENRDDLALECSVGQVRVQLTRDSLESPVVYIKISDAYGGRDAK